MKPQNHIWLIERSGCLILEWSYPVVTARLIMVDECILRVDYFVGQVRGLEKMYFPPGFNYKPYLKCSIWNEKEIIKADSNKRIYNFKN